MVDQTAIPKGWLARKQELLSLIERQLENRDIATINLTPFTHSDITLALWEAVHAERYVNKKLSLCFEDGSIAPNFPLGCLQSNAVPQSSTRTLRIGLMSFRHPELDYLVDLYVVTNRDLAELISMEEQERLSFEKSLELLTDAALSDGAVLEIYHTGFEPIVVGFYRALVKVLKSKSVRNLTVVTKLFAVKRGESPYTKESPGAKPADYLTGAVWF
jgi:hypothetical protein